MRSTDIESSLANHYHFERFVNQVLELNYDDLTDEEDILVKKENLSNGHGYTDIRENLTEMLSDNNRYSEEDFRVPDHHVAIKVSDLFWPTKSYRNFS